MTHSLKTRKRLEEKCDEAIREYLRWRDASGHNFTCFICQITIPKEYASVGHYRKRGNHSTRWLLKNCHLICDDCQDEGNPMNTKRYGMRIDLKYGEGTAEWLTRLSHQRADYSLFDLMDIADSFQKLKETEMN